MYEIQNCLRAFVPSFIWSNISKFIEPETFESNYSQIDNPFSTSIKGFYRTMDFKHNPLKNIDFRPLI